MPSIKTFQGAVKGVVKGVAKAANKHIVAAMDNQFHLLMWLMGLWLTVTWLSPLVIDQMATTVWYDRSGLLSNMVSVKRFLILTDSAFVASCIIAVVMLTVGMILTAMYMYSTCRLNKMKAVHHVAFTEKPWFRCVWLMFFFLFMVAVSVAGILEMTCLESNAIKTDAMTMKHMGHKESDLVEFREYAKYALDMAAGRDVSYAAYSSMPSAGVLLGMGLLLRSEDGGSLTHMTDEAAQTYLAANKLYKDGKQVNSTAGYNAFKNSGLMTYTMTDGNLNLYSIKGPAAYTLNNVSLTMKKAVLKLDTKHDTMNNIVKYILEKQGNPSPSEEQCVALAGNPNLGSAVAAARLFCAQNSVAMYALYAGSAEELNMDAIIHTTHNCKTADMYSTSVFLASFILSILVNLFIILYKKVYLGLYKQANGHYRQNYGYEALKPQHSATEEWEDDEDSDDTAVVDEWKSVAPLSANAV